MTPRRVFALLAVLLVLGVACSSGGDPTPTPAGQASPSDPTAAYPTAADPTAADPTAADPTGGAETPTPEPGSLAELACSLPHQWLLRTWRGHMESRSADIQILPIEPNFVGSGLPHVGPWPYAQDIPMFWYGPGHVAPVGGVNRPVTLAGIAPTQAALLDFPFRTPHGMPMREAVAGNAEPPRLILTLIWDAAGRNVLDRWPEDWPYLRSLIPDGAWYERATVGSSPTSTAQTHATIGTGSFPSSHGIVAHRLRIGAELTTPWKLGPNYLLDPTLGDVYDLSMGNEPIVGELGTVSIHLGMLGHGSMWGGGDRDVAVVREKIGAETLGAEGFEWNLTPALQPYYRFPASINDVPGFDEDVREVDAADGQIDGRWRQNEIAPLLQGFDTPARIPYQTRVLMELIEREGFGADEVPDLLFVNYKMIDYISHVWTVNSPEMQDAVRAQDEQLEVLVDFLNGTVGEGEWALVLTADHGSIPDPDVTGAFQISATPIVNGINATFDTDGDDTKIVQLVQPTQVFVDEAELEENGHTLEEVAEWIMGLTKADTHLPDVVVPADEADDPVFQAAFPSSLMSELPCLPEARV
ncbi:MAG TPA: alkaline phosphatase family protein [Actinomycetota bacterium]